MSGYSEGTESWRKVMSITRTMLRESLAEFGKIPNQIDELRRAIGEPHEREVALLLLIVLPPQYSKCLFAELVDVASVGHSDIALCRAVLKMLPRRWVLERIEPIVQRLLDASPSDDEAFRRFAELYQELDNDLLSRLIQTASSSAFDEIREVAADYTQNPSDT